MIRRLLPRRAVRLLALLVAAVVTASGALAAFAEDTGDVFRLRAFDRTAMIEGQAEDGSMKDVPMRPSAVQCLVLGGKGSTQFDAKVEADGSVAIPRASVPQGSTITLKAEQPGSGIYVATGIDLWAQPAPERADFVRMATASPLFMPFGNVVVTGQDVGKPSAYVRVNVIAQIANPSSELWSGPRDGNAGDALRLPVPAGFTLVSAKRGNEDVDCKLVTDAAGRCEAVIAGGMYPPQTQSLIRLVLTGKWEDGARYDLSFRAFIDIAEWNLAIDPTLFSYDSSAGGGQELLDGGMRPGVNGIETRVWMVREIRAGTPVSQVFVQGRLIDPKVWRTIAIFVLTAVGAALLGRALAGGRRGAAVAAAAGNATGAEASPPLSGPNSGAERDAALEELRRRYKRGEMSEFEFNARKALLTAPAKRSGAPEEPAAPRAAPAGSALERVREIEARAATASPDQLRADVGTLAALVREFLRK